MKVLKAALEAMEGGERAALVTVIGVGGSTPRHSASRMLVMLDGSIVGTIGGGEWERRVIQTAVEQLESGSPLPQRFAAHLTHDLGMCCGGNMEVFIETLARRERFHCFGAGHVGGAISSLARTLEFEVFVYDDREDWLTEERFPGCTRVEGDPKRTIPDLGPLDYALIVTHSHQLDQQLLMALLGQDFAYLGMIGSRAKIAKFFTRLRAAEYDQELFSRVSAPVGLDLGAETPEEIAVAIAAELVTVRRRSTGPPIPMSQHPLPARGGDGRARPPAFERDSSV